MTSSLSLRLILDMNFYIPGRKFLLICQSDASRPIRPENNKTAFLPFPSSFRPGQRTFCCVGSEEFVIVHPVLIVASISCCYLTGLIFFIDSYIPSDSSFNMLCIQIWYSRQFDCSKWLFELLLFFCHFTPICSFSGL